MINGISQLITNTFQVLHSARSLGIGQLVGRRRSQEGRKGRKRRQPRRRGRRQRGKGKSREGRQRKGQGWTEGTPQEVLVAMVMNVVIVFFVLIG